MISWDSYTFDTPVLDLYNLYLNEWESVEFSSVFKEYNKSFNLLDEEKKLLDILISIPHEVKLDSNEYHNCRKIRKLIDYLSKSSKIVIES